MATADVPQAVNFVFAATAATKCIGEIDGERFFAKDR